MLRICLLGAVIGLITVPVFAQDPTDRAGWAKKIEVALEEGKDKEVRYVPRPGGQGVSGRNELSASWPVVRRARRETHQGEGVRGRVRRRGAGLEGAAGQRTDEHPRLCSTLYRFWSQDLLRKKDLDGSLKVLASGYALLPNDPHIHAGIAFHAQEALAIAEGKSVDAVIEQYKSPTEQFPKVEADIAERGQRLAELAVSKLVDKMKFKEAVEAVERYGPLLPKAEQRAKAGGIAYDGWALHLADKKEWEPALAKYAEGLKAYPGHARLLNNALIIVEHWAQPAVDAKNWDEAIRIYGIAAQALPGQRRIARQQAAR